MVNTEAIGQNRREMEDKENWECYWERPGLLNGMIRGGLIEKVNI